MNDYGGCVVSPNSSPANFSIPAEVKPGMPQRAPNIFRTSQGPLSFPGAVSTVPGAVPASTMPTQYYSIQNSRGLTGYAPPWSDAWVMQV